jgi:hypothetical protein
MLAQIYSFLVGVLAGAVLTVLVVKKRGYIDDS